MSDYLLNLSGGNPFVGRLIKVLESSGQWISLIRGTEMLTDILKHTELEPQAATDESSDYLADATALSAASCAQTRNTHLIPATDVNVHHGYIQSAQQYIHHMLSLRKLAVAFILLIHFPQAFSVANEVRIVSHFVLYRQVHHIL